MRHVAHNYLLVRGQVGSYTVTDGLVKPFDQNYFQDVLIVGFSLSYLLYCQHFPLLRRHSLGLNMFCLSGIGFSDEVTVYAALEDLVFLSKVSPQHALHRSGYICVLCRSQLSRRALHKELKQIHDLFINCISIVRQHKWRIGNGWQYGVKCVESVRLRLHLYPLGLIFDVLRDFPDGPGCFSEPAVGAVMKCMVIALVNTLNYLLESLSDLCVSATRCKFPWTG